MTGYKDEGEKYFINFLLSNDLRQLPPKTIRISTWAVLTLNTNIIFVVFENFRYLKLTVTSEVIVK